MNRDKLDKANLAAAIAIGSTLTGLLLVRAYSLSLTHDESLTYLHGVRPGLVRILAFSYVDANNHLFNTLLTWLSSLAFGNAELALRLPNVAAFVLFFATVFLLLRRRVRPLLVVPGLLLLTCNPFQLDFFALCRGYGLGLGFMAASLYFALESLERGDGGGESARQRRRNAARSGWFALAATLANLTLLNYYLALLVVLGMLQFARERKDWLADASAAGGSRSHDGFLRAFLGDWAAPQLRQALLLAAVLTPMVVKLRMKGSFYLGGDTGFWRDTVGSLVEGVLYSQPYSNAGRFPLEIGVAVVLAAATAVLAARFKSGGAGSNAAGGLLAPGLLAVCFLSVETQHLLLGTPFLTGRAALFLVPLSGLTVVFSCDALVEHVKSEWAGTLVAIVLGLAAATHTAASVNTTHTHSWAYDADTKHMMEDLRGFVGARRLPPRKLRLGSEWIYQPTVNYYSVKHHLDWLEPMTRREFNGDFDFYFFHRPAREERLKGLNLTVLNEYPFTDRALALRQGGYE
jgi:hypothetical protein